MQTGWAAGAMLAWNVFTGGSSTMEYRLPSHEELVDLSWLLDSAVACGDRARTIEFANRFLESLLHYRDGIAGSRPAGGATTPARRDACSSLVTDVATVLSRVHHGDNVGRVEFRYRVEALAA